MKGRNERDDSSFVRAVTNFENFDRFDSASAAEGAKLANAPALFNESLTVAKICTTSNIGGLGLRLKYGTLFLPDAGSDSSHSREAG